MLQSPFARFVALAPAELLPARPACRRRNSPRAARTC